MFFFDLFDHCAHQLLPLRAFRLQGLALEPQRFLKLRKAADLAVRGDLVAGDATDGLAIWVIGHEQLVLALRPHFAELDWRAHVRGVLWLRVADVVVVGGTEVGLVEAF